MLKGATSGYYNFQHHDVRRINSTGVSSLNPLSRQESLNVEEYEEVEDEHIEVDLETKQESELSD